MRLKTSLWIKSYIRTCFAKGAHAFVICKGDEDAGQIFIKCNHLDGSFTLYGPAPALSISDHDNRKFEAKSMPHSDEATVSDLLESQQKFDPDIWIIEVESKEGEVYLD